MEIKGIDVSSWNGKPDWGKAAETGLKFAILRITELNGVDTSFEHNYKGCKDNHIPTGVYKYSYALSIKAIQEEAKGVINTLSGRCLEFPVWLDLEWSKMRNLSPSLLTEMVEAFRSIILEAGYLFGIYCNTDWYRNVIPSALKKYEFWIAAYPYNDDGKIHEALRPSAGVGWQYSSKGKVLGITGNVDLDVFYKDFPDACTPNPPDYGTEKPDKTPKWVGAVTANWLNVRILPGTQYPLLSQWPGLKQGNLVDVCDSMKDSAGREWYYIRIDGQYYGFVSAAYIKRQ